MSGCGRPMGRSRLKSISAHPEVFFVYMETAGKPEVKDESPGITMTGGDGVAITMGQADGPAIVMTKRTGPKENLPQEDW
jgi:hypothetical protein